MATPRRSRCVRAHALALVALARSPLIPRLSLAQDPKKEYRLISCLQFIHTQVYRAAFGRPADGLEKSFGGEDECESRRSLPFRPPPVSSFSSLSAYSIASSSRSVYFLHTISAPDAY